MAIYDSVYGFYMPGVTRIGVGAHREIPEQLRLLGAKKPLIVTDRGIVDSGIAAAITDLLTTTGMDYAVFDAVVPNPTDHNVVAGGDVYKKSGCDAILTLGGGSPHDCGKGIGLIISNGGVIADYEGLNRSSAPMPPFLAVNTTSGTASEMTRFCIITDTSRKVKMAIVDWRVTPNVAINDPLLMVKMPRGLTAATGMDALTHAVEAYVSTDATPMTDACAEKAIDLVFRYLPRAVANGDDLEARIMMTQSQYLAGMAFNNASLGLVHAMAHQLGGFYDLPHGECNAVLLPFVLAFNLLARQERITQLVKSRSVDQRKPVLGSVALGWKFVHEIRELANGVGIPENLAKLGRKYGMTIVEADIEIMTANALKDACAATNPRKADFNDVKGIFMEALTLNEDECE